MESSYFKILTSSASNYQKIWNVYRKLVVPRVVKTVKSNYRFSFWKNRISDFFGLKDDHKLNAIYNGVSEHFKPITNEEELKRVKKI
jgi:hypothetical protein